MATQFPGDRSSGMVDRIKRLLTTPAQEWPRIDADPMTVKGIFMAWVVPLAAIGPVAHFIGMVVFGFSILGITIRPSVTVALGDAVSSYLLSLVGTYVMALVIDWLAPNFNATKNPVAAMKLIAFSMTAPWIAAALQILPGLTPVAVLIGLYGFYLLWVGLPVLMKAPADKAPAYIVVSILACAVAFAIMVTAATAITRTLIRAPLVADSGTVSGTVTVPGLGAIDVGKANDALARMKAANERMKADAASGTSSAIPATALQALLPASIGGFTRTDVETQSGGIGGINGSHAEARYTQGDQSFRLSVTDMNAAGSLIALGGAVNMQSSRQTATGYEKTDMVGGARVTEKWDTQSHSGAYETMAASRFMVSAEGSAPSIDTLKQAVGSIDTGKLAALAR